MANEKRIIITNEDKIKQLILLNALKLHSNLAAKGKYVIRFIILTKFILKIGKKFNYTYCDLVSIDDCNWSKKPPDDLK